MKEIDMKKTLKPGELAPRTGEYEIRGRHGGHTGQERTVIKGMHMPPTPKAGQQYKMHRTGH
jgi:hypothetical protein